MFEKIIPLITKSASLVSEIRKDLENENYAETRIEQLKTAGLFEGKESLIPDPAQFQGYDQRSIDLSLQMLTANQKSASFVPVSDQGNNSSRDYSDIDQMVLQAVQDTNYNIYS